MSLMTIGAAAWRRAASGGDPNWANVVSMCPFNGPDGSTSITDHKGKIWTCHGDAQISTAQSYYGGSSLRTDGSGDYISTPAHADWSFGTDDFTIEFFFRMAQAKMYTLFDFRGGASNSPRPMVYGNAVLDRVDIRYYVSGGERIAITTGGSPIIEGDWLHFAVCRVSGQTRMFIDGSLMGSPWSDSTNYTNDGVLVCRNTQTDARDVDGNIQFLRVYKGYGAYSSNFTPPPVPFPNHGP